MEARNAKKPKREKVDESVEIIQPLGNNHHAMETMRSLREGSHYTLKIEPFSIFRNSDMEIHESRPFDVGGYKWKLRLYPNGNKRRNVTDHISLYLAIADTKTLPLGWEVNVVFTLFVFNHITNKYLTIRDTEGGIACFHGMKIEWGLDKFLPLQTLTDSTKGYLVEDCCIFGAEVFVTKHNGKGECFSLIKVPVNNTTFTWKVEKFSAKEKGHLQYQFSSEFAIGDHKWKLLLYPKGFSTATGKSLSLYLALSDVATRSSGSKVYAEYTLRLRDQVRGKHIEKKGKSWISGWMGFADFLALSDLNMATKGFKVNDTVIVEVEITCVSSLKYT